MATVRQQKDLIALQRMQLDAYEKGFTREFNELVNIFLNLRGESENLTIEQEREFFQLFKLFEEKWSAISLALSEEMVTQRVFQYNSTNPASNQIDVKKISTSPLDIKRPEFQLFLKVMRPIRAIKQVSDIAAVFSESFMQEIRESQFNIFNRLGNTRPFIYVEANGCNYCKTQAAKITYWGEGSKIKINFHKSCRCILTATFQKEAKPTQRFEKEFESKVEQAELLLKKGEAGDRLIQRGTQEFSDIVKDEISTRLGNKSTQELVNRYHNMINKESVNLSEYMELARFNPEDLERWTNPITKPLDDPTDIKQIAAAIDILENKRQVA